MKLHEADFSFQCGTSPQRSEEVHFFTDFISI